MIKKPKTKLIATLGPATNSREMVEKLMLAGVSIFRINFSHSSHSQAAGIIRIIRDASNKLDAPAAIIGDLQGPKIRIGNISTKDPKLSINSKVSIINEERTEDPDEIPLPDKEVFDSIVPGQKIVLGDGEIELICEKTLPGSICVKVANEGRIKSHMGLHLPGHVIKLSSHLDKDIRDFSFCAKNGVDFIMLSFIQTRDDILLFKNKLKEMNAENMKIGSKIETQSSIDHLDEIITNSDFVVVARGDLAIETSYFDIPIHQKSIIQKSNQYGIPVIVATQMLESMIINEEPTRAEISDIANAILDGTDAVMLSGETAVGKHPVKAVEILKKTSFKIEKWLSQHSTKFMRKLISDDIIADAISRSAMIAGDDLDAKCLICTTKTGKTARLLSRYRPKSPILAFTYSKKIINILLMFWGVYPYEIEYKENFGDQMENSIKKASDIYSLQPEDIILYSAGISDIIENTPQTNLLHIRKIKKAEEC